MAPPCPPPISILSSLGPGAPSRSTTNRLPLCVVTDACTPIGLTDTLLIGMDDGPITSGVITVPAGAVNGPESPVDVPAGAAPGFVAGCPGFAGCPAAAGCAAGVAPCLAFLACALS